MLPRPMLEAIERLLFELLRADPTLEITMLLPEDAALAPIVSRLCGFAAGRVRTMPPSSPLRSLRRWWTRPTADADARAADWLRRAECDICLLPHAAVRIPLDVPTVALLHDDTTAGFTRDELARMIAPRGLLGRPWPSSTGSLDVIGQSYYRRWLGRSASDEERRVWIRELERGASEEDAVVIFLSSPEYRESCDGPRGWALAVHEHLFGRRPSVAESERAVETIERGASHEDALRAILAGPESAGARDGNQHRRFGSGPPDAHALGAARLLDALVALRASEATLCVVNGRRDDESPDPALRLGVGGRSRRIAIDEPGRASEWIDAFHDARERACWPRAATAERSGEPSWPTVDVAEPVRREAFVFLQSPAVGGVWEVTKDILVGVAAIARERGTLSVTIGLAAEHPGRAELAGLLDGVVVRPFRLAPMASAEASRLMRARFRSATGFCFFAGAEHEALRADAWLGLTDRFPLPLLPARPYAVVIHDVISRHVPGAFAADFFTMFETGMRPTMRGAERFVVTNDVTGGDAIAEYGLQAARQRLIPVAWDAARRFAAKRPRHVDRIREPFLLNVTNAHPHKGTLELLHAFSRLRDDTHRPLALVVCGGATETFSALHAFQSPYHRAVRDAVTAHGLREGEDVHFLGYVSDEELIDLYERSALVVNAARGDNGCFNSIEAAYFGRPAVSTRYPAAEWLRARFAIPLRFYEAGDPGDFVAAVEAALAEASTRPADVAAIRSRLASEEFSSRRYAERFYDLLCELAALGRSRRSSAAAPCS